MKKCPCCGEEILAVAKKSRRCGEWLEEMSKAPVSSKDKTQTVPSEGMKPTNEQIVTKTHEKREESKANGVKASEQDTVKNSVMPEPNSTYTTGYSSTVKNFFSENKLKIGLVVVLVLTACDLSYFIKFKSEQRIEQQNIFRNNAKQFVIRSSSICKMSGLISFDIYKNLQNVLSNQKSYGDHNNLAK